MNKLKSIFTKKQAGYALTACIAVVLYEFLEHFEAMKPFLLSVKAFLSPIIIGIAIAYLFDPLADDVFERKLLKNMKNESARHTWGVILTIVCIVLILVLLLVALIPSVAKSISKLVSNWDEYNLKLHAIIGKIAAFAGAHNIKIDMSPVEGYLDNLAGKIMEIVKNNSKSILSTLGEIGSGVSNFGVGIIFGFCFLGAKKTLLKFLDKIRRALHTNETIERNNQLFGRCHKIFVRYVGCTLLDACIVGVATLIFMLIMGMPYAPLIAVVVALTNIIPTFGPMIGSAIGIFFLILENPMQALWFFIFSCILQSIDGMVIKPRLFSNSLGIPAVWTLVLIILGGKIAGMLGIILAIPFAAIFVIIYQETIEPRLEKRTMKLNGESAAEKPENTEEQTPEEEKTEA
ncbi:MAG: AI-2E family transporter [Clostridia bacterium]|nr:AI-2E family transporter [Clostridia bacterium]